MSPLHAAVGGVVGTGPGGPGPGGRSWGWRSHQSMRPGGTGPGPRVQGDPTRLECNEKCRAVLLPGCSLGTARASLSRFVDEETWVREWGTQHHRRSAGGGRLGEGPAPVAGLFAQGPPSSPARGLRVGGRRHGEPWGAAAVGSLRPGFMDARVAALPHPQVRPTRVQFPPRTCSWWRGVSLSGMVTKLLRLN